MASRAPQTDTLPLDEPTGRLTVEAPETEPTEERRKPGPRRPIPERLRELRATLYRITAEATEMEPRRAGPGSCLATESGPLKAEALLAQAAQAIGQAEALLSLGGFLLRMVYTGACGLWAVASIVERNRSIPTAVLRLSPTPNQGKRNHHHSLPSDPCSHVACPDDRCDYLDEERLRRTPRAEVRDAAA